MLEEMDLAYYQVTDDDLWQKVMDDCGRRPGVYYLKLRDKALKAFAPIQRLLGRDDGGTLYIGTSADLVARIDSLRKAICAAYEINGFLSTEPHPVGRVISKKLFRNTIAHERLWVEPVPLVADQTDGHSHYDEEARLLEQYAERYGEFPPLNGPKPNRS